MAASLSGSCWCRLLALTGLVCAASAQWQQDLIPRRYVPLDERSMLRFAGNATHKDHFRLLENDGDSLLIGARNIVFNISLVDLTERREERLEWHSEPEDVDLCIMKGLDEEACHNYIRVLAKRGDDELFVCGTNSYKPKCRHYQKHPELGYLPKGGERDGRGLCPYDPNHNSTVTFVGDETYAGTVADLASSDPLIYRDKRPLRTDKLELKQLNAPSFVGSMDYGDHVYFFFRETAVEYMNCGKSSYSRVARVCKKDRGGPYKYKNKWTSFLKSRLNCSIPGEYPFYFDEIQSISSVQTGVYGGKTEEVLYAVFTTPVNSIAGSAVCAFRMADLVDTFAGAFKHQEDMNSNWLPLKSSQVPSPRPGLCVNDSRQLSDAHLNFIQSHPLMDGAVPSLHGRPLLARTSLRHRFTKIAVDPQVRAADGNLYDVLFIGTDDGRVLKAVNVASSGGVDGSVRAEPVLIEELEVVAGGGAAVTNLLVSRQPADAPPRLIVVTDDEVRALPLHRCGDKAVRCADCVRLQDPYCGWEAAGQRCAPVDSPAWPEGVPIVQNVTSGFHEHCAEDDARYEEEMYFATIPTAAPSSVPAAVGTAAACDCAARTDTAADDTDVTDADDDSDTGDTESGEQKDDADTDDDTNIVDLIEAKNDRELYSAVDETGKVYGIIEHSKSYLLGQATESRSEDAQDAVYTAKTLAIAVATTCLLAMALGFLAGWLFSRRWAQQHQQQQQQSPYYETAHGERSRLQPQADVVPLPVKPDNRVDLTQTQPNPEPNGFVGNNGKNINTVVNLTKNALDRKTDIEPGYDTLQKKRAMYL